MNAPKKNREPDHLDAWGAYFSPRRPLIQWICAMSDVEAAALMRRLGLSEPRPSEVGDGSMTLWDLIRCVNTQPGEDETADTKKAPDAQAPLLPPVLPDQDVRHDAPTFPGQDP